MTLKKKTANILETLPASEAHEDPSDLINYLVHDDEPHKLQCMFGSKLLYSQGHFGVPGHAIDFLMKSLKDMSISSMERSFRELEKISQSSNL